MQMMDGAVSIFFSAWIKALALMSFAVMWKIKKAGSQLAIMAVLYLPIRMRPWPQLLTLFLGWPRIWTPHWPPPKQNDP